MGIINRLLLLPYVLVTMALSVAVVAVALRIVPESVWLNELRYALSRQELLAVCGVFFLVSLKLFFAVFSRTSTSARTHGEFMVVDTKAGAVQVALSAVRGIVERVALSMQGVRTATAVISVHDAPKDAVGTPMQVELKIT
ncbi:alkaline shock response membrane anchor protein AmaP, partial [Selenomonas sp. oral taxon 126]|uniref:alkaline shock response membrane anchor protein AmaP n=1 Tax=Selenomonas sp. oral taxon 126 TaxID=712528 RepID=UPI001F4645F6